MIIFGPMIHIETWWLVIVVAQKISNADHSILIASLCFVHAFQKKTAINLWILAANLRQSEFHVWTNAKWNQTKQPQKVAICCTACKSCKSKSKLLGLIMPFRRTNFGHCAKAVGNSIECENAIKAQSFEWKLFCNQKEPFLFQSPMTCSAWETILLLLLKWMTFLLLINLILCQCKIVISLQEKISFAVLCQCGQWCSLHGNHNDWQQHSVSCVKSLHIGLDDPSFGTKAPMPKDKSNDTYNGLKMQAQENMLWKNPDIFTQFKLKWFGTSLLSWWIRISCFVFFVWTWRLRRKSVFFVCVCVCGRGLQTYLS